MRGTQQLAQKIDTNSIRIKAENSIRQEALTVRVLTLIYA